MQQKQLSIIKKIENKFYQTLVQEQINFIDKGYFDLRFYQVYAHLLEPV